MFATASGSVMANPYSDVDIDGDGLISRAEYDSYVERTDIYKNWDQNKDSRLDENEWNEPGQTNEFALWDINNDGYLDLEEFYNGSFSNYDYDNDAMWNEDEFGNAREGVLSD